MKNKLKEFRKEKKMTQEKLARKTGVTRQTINAIEKGRYDPSLSLAFKFSRLFKVPIEVLFEY